MNFEIVAEETTKFLFRFCFFFLSSSRDKIKNLYYANDLIWMHFVNKNID
jgi:hypothetical protein